MPKIGHLSLLFPVPVQQTNPAGANIPADHANTPAEQANVPANAPAGQANVPAHKANAPANQVNVPVEQVNVSAASPAGQANVPIDQVNAPANVPAGRANAPAAQVNVLANIPAEQANVPADQVNVPSNASAEQSNVPADQANVPADVPANVPADQANIPAQQVNSPTNQANTPNNQVNSVECLKLRELEFEQLVNPGPVVPPPRIQETEPVTNTTSLWRRIFNKLKFWRLLHKKRLSGAGAPAAPARNQPVPTDTGEITEIDSFCSTIRDIPEGSTCVGVLVSKNNRHQVSVPRASLAMLKPAKVVSLAELLSLPSLPVPSKRERLKLGMRLASSVLQFHETTWLQERWSKRDIYLIQGDSQPKSYSLETPVVCQAFTPDPSVPETSMDPNTLILNLSLFSLGIVLIELWFWKSMESLQANKSQADCPLEDLDTAIYNTARTLFPKLYDEAGADYTNSVKFCIHGLGPQETKLVKYEVKNKVYQNVVQPLGTNLETFYRQPLREILEKRDS